MPNKNAATRRLALGAFDACSLALVALVVLVSCPQTAWGYVDPSVMTYTIQALAGVAVALSAVLGVALRRTRKVLMRALNIDENAGKEVEPNAHRVDASGQAIVEGWEASSDEAGVPSAKRSGRARSSSSARAVGDKPSWLRRFVLSFIVVAFCGFTLGIAAPFEIVAGNAGSLAFGIADVWLVVVLAVLAIVVVVSLLLSLVPGKAFSHVLVVVFCFGLCCYVQAMFMNVGLPSANGDTVNFWSDHATMMIVSSVVWLLVLIVPTCVCGLNRSRFQFGAAVLSVCLIVVQAVGVVSLLATPQEGGAKGPGAVQVTEDGLFEVSDKNNVVVFILDRFETGLFDRMVEEDPDLLDGLDGFTYYRDSVGTMLPTLNAIPNLLTGETPKVGEDYLSFQKDRYVRSSFLEDINEAGYSVGLYSDTMELQYMDNGTMRREVADQTINMHSTESANINAMGVLGQLAKCALYRDMPWVLKGRFWFYTDEVNSKSVQWQEGAEPKNTPYVIDDARYYGRLQQYGLSVENRGSAGAFRFIHLTGAHSPYAMNENAQYVGVDAVTREQQATGALHIVKEYVQDLKDLGLYDNSTIIIMADHGDWESSLEPPTFAISPLFMMKPAGVSDGAVVVSDIPVSHSDFQATVLDAMGADGSAYGTPVSELEAAPRDRDAYMITSDGHNVIDILRYVVDGYALDFNNWEYAGDSWHVNDAAS